MQVESKYHITREEQQLENSYIEAAKNNPAGFEPLYNKYHEQIFRFIYQRVSDKDVAADVCSEVFVKAMTNLSKYEYRGLPFSSWLYRIASNEIIQLARNNSKCRTVNIEDMQIGQLMHEMDEKENNDLIEKLIQSIAGLSEGELQMIEMRFFEGRPFAEMGEILNITENNAKVKMYRLLDKLKKMISSEK